MKARPPFAWAVILVAAATACASAVLIDPDAGLTSDAGTETVGPETGPTEDSSGYFADAYPGEARGGGGPRADGGRPGEGSESTDGQGAGDGDGGGGEADAGGADQAVTESGQSRDAGTADSGSSEGGDPCAQFSASCTYCTPNRGGPGCGWCNEGCYQGTSAGPLNTEVCGTSPWVWKSGNCP